MLNQNPSLRSDASGILKDIYETITTKTITHLNNSGMAENGKIIISIVLENKDA